MNSIISPFARLHSLTLPRRDWLAGLFAFGAFTLISAGMAVAQTTGSAATAVTAGSAQFGDLPDNAVSVSNGWRCRDGLALGDSGNCELIRLPLNAIVTGNEWVYMPGLSQDGETFERLMRLQTDMCGATTGTATSDGTGSKTPVCEQWFPPMPRFAASAGPAMPGAGRRAVNVLP